MIVRFTATMSGHNIQKDVDTVQDLGYRLPGWSNLMEDEKRAVVWEWAKAHMTVDFLEITDEPE